MDFPVTLKNTFHKHGGRIISVSGIAHEANPPKQGYSRDTWWYIGDVDWNDGTKSDNLEIAPWAVCYLDENQREEVLALSEALSDYLSHNGTWCGHESKHQGWYANERPKVRRRA